MDLQTIAFIVTGVLTLLASFLAYRFNKVKVAMKEIKEALVTIVDAVEDNTIDETELQNIVKEVKEAGAAVIDIFKPKA